MSGLSGFDRPAPSANAGMAWTSDIAAELLRRFGVRYIAQNPGSSFGALHDSLVNYLGNDDPTMLLCLNENQVVAIAQGYAKVTEEPMGCIMHSNVGLLAGTMSIYNAWCDRVPMIMLGAGGPADAARRVPWINWIHSSKDQGALIRHFTKWDAEPHSPQAMVEAMLRANILTRQAPKGPVYICLDIGLQDAAVPEGFEFPDLARFGNAASPEPSAEAIERAADLLVAARNPIIMAGRVSRRIEDWNNRIRLAELLGASVTTDLKTAAGFPTDHPLHVGLPGYHYREPQRKATEEADVILGLDWMDFGGILRFVYGNGPIRAKVIQCSVDSYVHNGWSMDHFSLPTTDLPILAEPDIVVRRLLAAVEARLKGKPAKWDGMPKPGSGASMEKIALATDPDAPITPRGLGTALDAARAKRKVCLARVPLGWVPEAYHFRDPLDYVGYDGGAGVGSGPGNAIGAALALMGSDRIAAAVIGDGDFMQGASAFWTAAHYRIPALVIVANNRSHLNDELIQEKIAARRGRSVENAWVGQRIDEPAVDHAAMARAQGVAAEGPVTRIGDLPQALERAFRVVEGGAPCVVDVVVRQRESASSFAERKH